MNDAYLPEALLADLRLLVSGRNNDRRLYFWEGDAAALRERLSGDSAVQSAVAWLDVNDLAEDVLSRLAQRSLRAALARRIDAALGSDKQVLVVVNPYLLIRYEPDAPLAAFWDRFIGSQRTVIVVLPPTSTRPIDLPPYVQFRAGAARRLYSGAIAGAILVGAQRGLVL